MRGILFFSLLVGSSSALAADPACEFVNSVLGKAKSIISMTSVSAMEPEMCSLAKSVVDSSYISKAMLGNYATSGDKSGVTEFTNLVPSILVTDIVAKIPKNGIPQVSVQVDDSSTKNSDGTYSVGVSVSTSSGSYSGTVILEEVGSSFELVDADYMWFSADSYLGQSIQQDLGADSSPTPVADEVKKLESQSGFVHCE